MGDAAVGVMPVVEVPPEQLASKDANAVAAKAEVSKRMSHSP
jgi:hypothetical protein